MAKNIFHDGKRDTGFDQMGCCRVTHNMRSVASGTEFVRVCILSHLLVFGENLLNAGYGNLLVSLTREHMAVKVSANFSVSDIFVQ